jgi:hypothetical protein
LPFPSSPAGVFRKNGQISTIPLLVRLLGPAKSQSAEAHKNDLEQDFLLKFLGSLRTKK